MSRWTAQEGAPRPLGVSYIAGDAAYNFALYSKHATGVRLLLFRAEDSLSPMHVVDFDPRQNKSGRIWHCRVPASIVDACARYGYQVDGPHQPEEGQRFDQKVLLDPYARKIHFPPQFSRESATRRGENAGRAPLGVLHERTADEQEPSPPPEQHAHDAIIYEVHVRGFTQRPNSGVSAERRGSFLGLIDKIPYLRELGVTVVELMPAFQFDPQERNYWGYMPISFFALHDGYRSRTAGADEREEFREMVDALHAAGIEVVLDVVYNHTGEGGDGGPAYSFKGIDNTTYYLLDGQGNYRNDSGTGNVLHTANRYVAGMVLDSLHYWTNRFAVDGFRFDLASLFTRADDGSIALEQAPVIGGIQSHPDLAAQRLIAEAWDMASYQLGRTFPGLSWLQWNGKFRDDVRSFVRGDGGFVDLLMRRLGGSGDVFPDDLMDAYHAYQSVNFVTCHDGFCLYDLVSYDRKHNEANGHDNRDGADKNLSWNCGWEGDDGVPDAVLRLRRQQARNLFCLTLLANGTPMFVAGDEFLNTQRGNNNPYNQDNETTWLDWNRLDRNRDFFRFCKLMIAFRKAHPTLGRSRLWRDDVQWHGAIGAVDISPAGRALAFCLRGASQGDVDLYVMINGSPEDTAFRVQEQTPGGWQRTIDTARDAPEDILDSGREKVVATDCLQVAGRSIIVLTQRSNAVAAR
jgi:isoamylase